MIESFQRISPQTETIGSWLAIASGLCYGLLGYFGVSLMRTGLSVANLSFWRFLVSGIFLLLLVIVTKRALVFADWRAWCFAFMCGALFYCPSGMLFFVASKYVSTGQTMVVFFTYPAFVMILNYIFLGQKLKAKYILSFMVILLGLMCLVDMSKLSFNLTGIGLSIISALSYAVYVFLSKKNTLPPMISTILVSFGCAFTCLIFALFDQSLTIPSTSNQLFYLLGIGVLCAAIPIVLMLEAMKYISSDKASLLSVLEPVFTVIFGVILLGETMSYFNMLGVIMILAGAMSIVVRPAIRLQA